MKKRRSAGGFSLVELLIAIALVAIVSAIAIPQFQRSSANANLKTAAREVMGDFSEAKQRAIAENRDYRITLNVSLNNYSLTRSVPPAAWEAVGTGPKSLSSFGSGINLYTVSFSGVPVITFQKRGTASAGTLILRNRLGSMAVITVNITGRAYVMYSMH